MSFRFRWATCQLETVRKCRRMTQIQQALKTLPETLDETYDRILSSIAKEDREDAKFVLQLLSVSFQPLSLEEVAEALAVNMENQRFEPENRLMDLTAVLEICSSLVALSGYQNF